MSLTVKELWSGCIPRLGRGWIENQRLPPPERTITQVAFPVSDGVGLRKGGDK